MPETDRQIDTLLNLIEPLRGAKVIRALPGGPASDSWLLQLHGELLVARIDNPLVDALGLDRHAESHILKIVSDAGIGPRLHWCDPDQGLQVCNFLEGEPWSRETMTHSGRLRQLAKTLRKLHQLPPAGPLFEPAVAAGNYADEMGTLEADKMAGRAQELALKLQLDRNRTALCHNDPVFSNIIGEDPLRLVDWEYAAVGDPFFDLAVVIRHHHLSASLREVFVRAYANHWPARQLARLDEFCELYDLLAGLWYLTMVKRFGPLSSFMDDLQRVKLRLKETGLNF